MTVAPFDPGVPADLRPVVRVLPAPRHTPPYDDEPDLIEGTRPRRRLSVLPGQAVRPPRRPSTSSTTTSARYPPRAQRCRHPVRGRGAWSRRSWR